MMADSTHQAQPAWRDEDLRDNPHETADKAKRVREMFAAIARSYDINNRVHSLWRDQAWRKKAVKLTEPKPAETVLDIACGTGDLTLAFARQSPARVIGLDFTHQMTVIANDKKQLWQSAHPSIKTPISFGDGDATQLPLPDQSVDIVSIAFGIRNVAKPEQAIAEFYRILRPGGRVCILEFSLPRNPILRAGYNFYFKHIMPRTAALIARDRSGAYKYLPRSVNTFLGREQMVTMLNEAGFCNITQKPMTFGIAVAYIGQKK